MTTRLKEMNAPTLIMAGRWDSVFPMSDEEKMDELIPHFQLAIFENSGHSSHKEEPEAFQEAIRDFLGTASIYSNQNISTTWGSIKK